MSERIIFIDIDESLHNSFKSFISSTQNSDSEIEYTNELNLNDLVNVSSLIINIDYVKDIKKLKTILDKYNIDNIILLTNTLNSKKSQLALMNGFNVHFRSGMLLTLYEKIYNTSYRKITNTSSENEKTNFNGSFVCTFISAAGGVGKTTLLLNTAIKLSTLGKRVLVVDFSQVGDIRAKLNIVEQEKSLTRILTEFEKTDEAIAHMFTINSLEENLVYFEADKKGRPIEILLASNFVNMDKMNSQHVDQLIQRIREMEYDCVLFDTSAEISQRLLSACDISNKIFLVTCPTVGNAWKILQIKEMIDNLGYANKCCLAINRMSKYLGFSNRELEIETHYPIIGLIKEHKDFAYQENNGEFSKQLKNKRFLKEINSFIMRGFDIDQVENQEKKKKNKSGLFKRIKTKSKG